MLSPIGDIERIIGRVTLGVVKPSELQKIWHLPTPYHHSEHAVPECGILCEKIKSALTPLPELADECSRALLDEMPATFKDGNIIKDGYSTELDELRSLHHNVKSHLIDIEEKEKSTTGLSTLKVGFNKVHGFFIELSKSQSENAPAHYMRRQIQNAERYITEELKVLEERVLSAQREALDLEKELITNLLATIQSFTPQIQKASRAVGLMDLLLAFLNMPD